MGRQKLLLSLGGKPVVRWSVEGVQNNAVQRIARMIFAKARELGATVTNGPMDMPIGRFGGLIDPQGASFTVMQPASGD